jgi:AcrR family transcriptional regulator
MARIAKRDGGLEGAETRERILLAAIELFSEKGFAAVAIREIAAAVGIKGASIYNHFLGKDAILEAILARHRELAASSFDGKPAAAASQVESQAASPADSPAESPAREMTLMEMLESAMSQSLSFMGKPGMDKIFKILSREQLNNDRIRLFFLEEYIEKPRAALTELFSLLVARGAIGSADPHLLASEFHAFIMYKYYENYLLRGDSNLDFARMAEEFRAHIAFFCGAVEGS